MLRMFVIEDDSIGKHDEGSYINSDDQDDLDAIRMNEALKG